MDREAGRSRQHPPLAPSARLVTFRSPALRDLETPRRAGTRLPTGRAIALTIAGFFVAALAWACLGKIDIIATAQGKIVPTGRTKTIQPLEAGTVTAIHVGDGDKVHEGDVLVELDRTVNTAEREISRSRSSRCNAHSRHGAAHRALRAGFTTMSAVEFTPPSEAPPYEVLRTRARRAGAGRAAGRQDSLARPADRAEGRRGRGDRGDHRQARSRSALY